MNKVLNFLAWMAGFAIIIFLLFKLFLFTRGIGYRIFSNEALDTPKNATESAITIRENESLFDIGKDLERKGIVEDGRIFAISLWTMDDHDRIVPGEYSVNSAQKPSELLETFTGEEEE